MQFKILPLTKDIQTLPSGFTSGGGLSNTNSGVSMGPGITPEDFTRPFLFLLLTQGFFVGLIIGKLAEGSLNAGIKHSFILMIAAYLVATGSNLFATPY
jgi:hypothetical protein